MIFLFLFASLYALYVSAVSVWLWFSVQRPILCCLQCQMNHKISSEISSCLWTLVMCVSFFYFSFASICAHSNLIQIFSRCCCAPLHRKSKTGNHNYLKCLFAAKNRFWCYRQLASECVFARFNIALTFHVELMNHVFIIRNPMKCFFLLFVCVYLCCFWTVVVHTCLVVKNIPADTQLKAYHRRAISLNTRSLQKLSGEKTKQRETGKIQSVIA